MWMIISHANGAPFTDRCSFASSFLRRLETAEHAMRCFARLVRLLLGPHCFHASVQVTLWAPYLLLAGGSSISEGKLKWGKELVLLGMSVQPSQEGVQFILCEDKSHKYRETISTALHTGYLSSGESVKLGGRLMFSTQHLFHKVGRAIIKPIYAQKSSRRAVCAVFLRLSAFHACRNGCIGPRLRRALLWWLEVLQSQIAKTRAWDRIVEPACHMFLDAASTPARCAAVLFIDGRILHTDAAPSKAMLGQFQARNDNQITGLEIFAIALGLSTFQREIAGRSLVIYSDNKGLASLCSCWYTLCAGLLRRS